MVAPVRHCIELQAVGELHLVGLAKLLELRPSFALPLALLRPYWVAVLLSGKFVELEGLFRRAVAVGCKAVQGGSWVQSRKGIASTQSAGAGRLGHSWRWCSGSGGRAALGVQPGFLVAGDWWVVGGALGLWL